MASVYEIITGRIIELLDKGVVPWQQPWHDAGLPKNLKSGKEYRGINIMLLSYTGFNSPYWLTFKQAKDLGGFVKAGAKGFPVVYWNLIKVKDETSENGKEKTVPLLKYHTVFNVDQCENIPVPQDNKLEFSPIERCERVIEEMPDKPQIEYGSRSACYVPSTDTIKMPSKESFISVFEFYSTMFHEILHSCGAAKRLNRNSINEPHAFGSEVYSLEEMIAELGCSFLCAETGIAPQTITNNASYIASWLGKLKNDKTFVIKAAGLAQKSVDFILNKHHEEIGN